MTFPPIPYILRIDIKIFIVSMIEFMISILLGLIFNYWILFFPLSLVFLFVAITNQLGGFVK